MIKAINTIREYKQSDETSTHEFLNKNLENANLTKLTINEWLTFMSNNNRIRSKLTNGKNSYFVTNNESSDTRQKMKFSIKYFFSKCDQIGSFLRIWSHLLKKSLIENFIFCAVWIKKGYKKADFNWHRNAYTKKRPNCRYIE